jgi:hypothetical protein
MTSQGTAHGRFQRAIRNRNLPNAEMAACEMDGLLVADALAPRELLAAVDPKRYDRTALRWLQRFVDERLPCSLRLRLPRLPGCGTVEDPARQALRRIVRRSLQSGMHQPTSAGGKGVRNALPPDFD